MLGSFHHKHLLSHKLVEIVFNMNNFCRNLLHLLLPSSWNCCRVKTRQSYFWLLLSDISFEYFNFPRWFLIMAQFSWRPLAIFLEVFLSEILQVLTLLSRKKKHVKTYQQKLPQRYSNSNLLDSHRLHKQHQRFVSGLRSSFCPRWCDCW